MKTTDPRDPLDQQIDALLASRPLKPSDDFASRVLEACDAPPAASTETKNRSGNSTLLRFALPIAAAVAVAFVLVPMLKQQAPTPTGSTELASTSETAPAIAIASTNASVETTISPIEEVDTHEILLIEDSLADLSLTEEYAELGSGELLATFDALLLDIQS